MVSSCSVPLPAHHILAPINGYLPRESGSAQLIFHCFNRHFPGESGLEMMCDDDDDKLLLSTVKIFPHYSGHPYVQSHLLRRCTMFNPNRVIITFHTSKPSQSALLNNQTNWIQTLQISEFSSQHKGRSRTTGLAAVTHFTV